jgi:dTDP-4-amino-4,6-dideoxygalactose transaminase
MNRIPFLRPNLVTVDDAMPYLRRMEESRIYSNFGPLNTEFESRILREYFGGVGAVTTVHNATVGLMLGIAAARRPGGRYAVMPSFTFAATPQAARWCGLEPYFVDIRPGDLCPNTGCIEDTVRRLGDEVGVVVPYATFGTACDLAYYDTLLARGVPVVVDAAASFGTRTERGQFGARFLGSVVFSFHATKAFGIGEGGLVYSANLQLLARIRQSSNFGFSEARAAEFVGLNGKLSEYGAAIGLATLDRFAAKSKVRQDIYATYHALMTERAMLSRGWQLQQITGSVPHQFMGALCPPGRSNDQYIRALDQQGIQARKYFSPACHDQPAFKGAPATSLAVTRDASARTLNLPLWEGMQPDDVLRVVDALDAI